jgi:Tol biopolymer transport system component/DNA-binding winged helix-turn-helix (wHTH) protein
MMGLPEGAYRFDQFVLDPLNLRLTANGENRTLEPKSFRLLQFLIENRRRVVPKDEILTVVWEGVAVSDNALTRAIAQVRKALDDDPKLPRYIETVPTVGYRFVAEVSVDRSAVEKPIPVAPRRKPGARRLLVWGVLAIALAAACIGVARFLWPPLGQQSVNEPAPFATYPGYKTLPSFSPDGNQIAFQWDGAKEDNFNIYVKTIGSETPLRLTTAAEADWRPQWSPDGRTIAFERVLAGGRVAIMLIPPLGGPERKLAEFVSHVSELTRSVGGTSWSPDAKWLAVCGDIELKGSDRIYLLSVETGEARPLTEPPAAVIGDSAPAFSPGGDALAFLRYSTIADIDLYVLNLGKDFSPRGEPKKLPAGDLRPDGLAWAAGGHQIVFPSAETGGLYRIPEMGGKPPERIVSLGTGVGTVALTRDGRRLAYSVNTTNSNIWRLDLMAKDAQAAAPERFIASTKREVAPQYSPDGRRIAFYSNRSGNYRIWVCNADGSKAAAITSMHWSASPRWSSDGRMIAFDSDVTGGYQIHTISADGGKVRQMTHGATANFGSGWSRDGRWIYFTSGIGASAQVWKMPSQGGAPVQVTRNGGMAAQESLDGKTLYYNKSVGQGSLWKMPVGGGPEEKIVDSIYRFNYAVTEKGIYLTRDGCIDFVDFATGQIQPVWKTPRPDLGLAISPDGRYLLFSQVDAYGSDLMLVESFR